MAKSAETKDALAAALRECLKDAPIDRITIKAITGACGLNRQTFYYHFKDIYELAKWTYVHDIDVAIKNAGDIANSKDALRSVIEAFNRNRNFHVAVYTSRNYYPSLRNEIIEGLTENLRPVFANRFESLGFDEVYREFLVRMYALIIFEYVERSARGSAFSTDEGFVNNWYRTITDQLAGARSSLGDR